MQEKEKKREKKSACMQALLCMILIFYKVKSNQIKNFIFNFSIILSFMTYLLAQITNQDFA